MRDMAVAVLELKDRSHRQLPDVPGGKRFRSDGVLCVRTGRCEVIVELRSFVERHFANIIGVSPGRSYLGARELRR
jgi:hypothetical protein